MDFSGFTDSIGSFAQAHTVIAIVIGVCILYFMYRNPKLFFSLLFLGLFVAGLFHVITDMASSGSVQKKRLLPGEAQQVDSTR